LPCDYNGCTDSPTSFYSLAMDFARHKHGQSDELLKQQSDEWIIELYEKYRKNKMIKWKDSVKKVVGIHRPVKSGLDI